MDPTDMFVKQRQILYFTGIATMVKRKSDEAKTSISGDLSAVDSAKASTFRSQKVTTSVKSPDPKMEPKKSKQAKIAAASAAYSEPIRKRPKNKLEGIQPDLPPSSSLIPDAIQSSSRRSQRVASVPPSDPSTTGPIPDPTTSLSSATAVATNPRDRSIVHIDHRTGNILGTYKSCYSAAKCLGISRHIVASLVKGIYKANHHKGWTFRYATSEEETATPDVKNAAVADSSEKSDLNDEDLERSDEDDESSDFEVHEVTITQDGSIGVMARRTRAPEAVVSLFSPNELFDGWSEEEMHFRIDSFVGKNSIAENSGMQVGDYLFFPDFGPGFSEPLIFGEYHSIAHRIRRQPRPLTFCAVRLKPNVTTPLSVNAKSDADNELVEDMDPMSCMEGKDTWSKYSYHPIVLTEWGPLGIKHKMTKSLPKGCETIPYFREHFNPFGPKREGFLVESLIGTDCLARRFGIQAGDYLVRPSPNYTPAKYNYQEAFYTHASVLDAIERTTRPITLYAIRLKSKQEPSKKQGRFVRSK